MLSWYRAHWTGLTPRPPKGLRHGFGVAAVSAGSPLNLVQKWLGHAQLTTTAIYADAVGEEEQSIAAQMVVRLEEPPSGWAELFIWGISVPSS